MINYQLPRLNKVADIGVTKSAVNPATGVNVPTFVKSGTIFYGSYTMTTTRELDIQGVTKTTDIVIVVRDDAGITDNTVFKIGSAFYFTEQIQREDAINGYNIITLSKKN